MACGPAAGASTAQPAKRVHIVHSAAALASARAELYKLLKRQHSTMRHVSTGATNLNGDWSGYGDTGSGFTKVSASWKEPTGKCGSSTTLAMFWVGIGGFRGTPFVQDGTAIECSDGSAFYFSWWEIDPSDPVQAVGSTVQPGDSITASVTRSGTSYTFVDSSGRILAQPGALNSTGSAFSDVFKSGPGLAKHRLGQRRPGGPLRIRL